MLWHIFTSCLECTTFISPSQAWTVFQVRGSSLLPSLILHGRVLPVLPHVPIIPIQQWLNSNCPFISSCLKKYHGKSLRTWITFSPTHFQHLLSYLLPLKNSRYLLSTHLCRRKEGEKRRGWKIQRKEEGRMDSYLEKNISNNFKVAESWVKKIFSNIFSKLKT